MTKKSKFTDRLQVRVITKEKEAFEKSAQLAGIPLSIWVRERLRIASINELKRVEYSIPFLEKDRSDVEQPN